MLLRQPRASIEDGRFLLGRQRLFFMGSSWNRVRLCLLAATPGLFFNWRCADSLVATGRVSPWQATNFLPAHPVCLPRREDAKKRVYAQRLPERVARQPTTCESCASENLRGSRAIRWTWADRQAKARTQRRMSRWKPDPPRSGGGRWGRGAASSGHKPSRGEGSKPARQKTETGDTP